MRNKKKICICPITENKLYLRKEKSSSGITSISAADSTIDITGTATQPILQAKPGGTAVSNIDMSGLTLTNASKVNVNGPISLLDIGGTVNGYELTGNNATTEVGIIRNQINSSETIVPNTKALMFDEIVYAPTSPFNPSSGFTAGSGSFTTGVQKLIASQVISLTQSNFPYKNQAKYIGVVGNISFILNSSQPLVYQIKYKKNNGSETNAYGGVYYTNTQQVTVPVNAITWGGGILGDTFKVDDTITWYIYATYALTTPTLNLTAPLMFSAVFSPLAI